MINTWSNKFYTVDSWDEIPVKKDYPNEKFYSKKPKRKLMTVTSFQDLLYKSANRSDYLNLMFKLVDLYRGDYVPKTIKDCTIYLDSIIESNGGSCSFFVNDCENFIVNNYLLEDEIQSEKAKETVDPSVSSTSSEMPKSMEKFYKICNESKEIDFVTGFHKKKILYDTWSDE